MVFLFLIAVSLSLDAFAVSVTSGLTVKNFGLRHSLLLGVYFGGFQFLMTFLGWYLGSAVEEYAAAAGPFISFSLLAVIGGKMVYSSVSGGEETACADLTHGRLLLLAIATSIDAFAVGVTFAFTDTNILLTCTVIGAVTFALSMLGGFIGGKLGSKFQKHAELAGGIVLILIGIKTLLSEIL